MFGSYFGNPDLDRYEDWLDECDDECVCGNCLHHEDRWLWCPECGSKDYEDGVCETCGHIEE